jgi:predicted peptidase
MIARSILPAILIFFSIINLQAQQTEHTIIHYTNYLLYIPDEKPESGLYPLILFLHGSGERGDDLELVKKNGPPSFLDDTAGFPFVVVSPQCPGNERWDPYRLLALLDHVEEMIPINKERIYVTGLSMGGQGTWILAMADPDRFAAIAPVCGRGDIYGLEKIKHIPVWVFHGALDDVVPLSESEKMVNRLTELGADVKYTIYPDRNHDSWTPTYSNPELYDWFLEQKRQFKQQ